MAKINHEYKVPDTKVFILDKRKNTIKAYGCDHVAQDDYSIEVILNVNPNIGVNNPCELAKFTFDENDKLIPSGWHSEKWYELFYDEELAKTALISHLMKFQKHNDDLIREAQEKIRSLGIGNVKLQVEIIKLAKS